ncbi:replication protein A 70 kDa DNA-binding subunit B [Tanacetum coccineum]
MENHKERKERSPKRKGVVLQRHGQCNDRPCGETFDASIVPAGTILAPKVSSKVSAHGRYLQQSFPTGTILALSQLKKMEINITQLCDLDPMLDDAKILARVIGIWKSHPKQRPNEVWSLDAVLQDQMGNRVQATVRNHDIKKFQPILDEGASVDERDKSDIVVMILQLCKEEITTVQEGDEAMITMFKKDFILEEPEVDKFYRKHRPKRCFVGGLAWATSDWSLEEASLNMEKLLSDGGCWLKTREDDGCGLKIMVVMVEARW